MKKILSCPGFSILKNKKRGDFIYGNLSIPYADNQTE